MNKNHSKTFILPAFDWLISIARFAFNKTCFSLPIDGYLNLIWRDHTQINNKLYSSFVWKILNFVKAIISLV